MNNLVLVKQQLELARPDFESNVEAMKLNLNFQKEQAFAMQIFQGNDYLTKMNPDSIKNALVNVALTGLTLNPVMKFAYLIPRKGKCVLDISYMGLAKILTDTGSVKNIEANVVYWNEPFLLERGTNPEIKHGIIDVEGVKKGNIRGAYSVATLNDGSKSIEWIDADDLQSIMMRSESVKKGKSSPWDSDTSEMCRKTVIKRHYKYLPKSERALLAATAIEIDHENNGIDFEEESKSATTQETVNIDVVDVNNSVLVEQLEQMMAAIPNPIVPNDLFGGESKQAFIDRFRSDLNSGTLQTSYAQQVYETVLKCFQQQ